MLLQMSTFCSFYDWVVFHCINTFYIFFIHSLVDWHFGCFHALAIVNNGVYLSLQIHFLIFGYITRGGIDGSYDNPVFNFQGTSNMFSTVAAPLYNPTNNVGGSLFSISSLTFIICRPVDDDHSDWCEVLLHCGFNFLFSNN